MLLLKFPYFSPFFNTFDQCCLIFINLCRKANTYAKVIKIHGREISRDEKVYFRGIAQSAERFSVLVISGVTVEQCLNLLKFKHSSKFDQIRQGWELSSALSSLARCELFFGQSSGSITSCRRLLPLDSCGRADWFLKPIDWLPSRLADLL